MEEIIRFSRMKGKTTHSIAKTAHRIDFSSALSVVLLVAALVCVASATADEVQGRMAANVFQNAVSNLRTRYAKIKATYGTQIQSVMYCITPNVATEGCMTSIFNCATAPSVVTIPDCLNSIACAGISIRSCVSQYWRI